MMRDGTELALRQVYDCETSEPLTRTSELNVDPNVDLPLTISNHSRNTPSSGPTHVFPVHHFLYFLTFMALTGPWL